MLKKMLFGFVMSALPTLVTAAEEYMCETTNFGNDGLIPPAIYLAYDPATDTGFAYDGFIAQSSKKPIEAKWKRRSETSYEFSWTARDIELRNGGSETVSHRVILYLDRKEFTMSGQLHGYDNNIRGLGDCKRVK